MFRKQVWFIFIAAFVWLCVNLLFCGRFTNLDFYGDGAWFSQSALRFLEYGWPSAPLSGVPLSYEEGWGPLVPWIYVSVLAAGLKILGVHHWVPLLISILASFGTVMLSGLLLAQLGSGRPSSLAFYLFLLLSPVILIKSHAPRPESAVMFWVMLCMSLILTEKKFPRLLGFFLLAWAAWIHQVAIIFSLFTSLCLGLYSIRKKSYCLEVLSTLGGIAFVFLVSIATAGLCGKLWSLIPAVMTYGQAAHWQNLSGVSIQILLPLLALLIFSCFWAIDRTELGKAYPILKPLILGIMIIPMLVLSTRPHRIPQFTYPLILIASYPVYLYVASKKRWLGYAFCACATAFLALSWARSYIPTYFLQNPIYLAKAAEFAERNRRVFAEADSALFRLKGESLMFWFLPNRLMLGAARYVPCDPYGSGDIIFLPTDTPPEDSNLSVLDSLVLGFTYSSYGKFAFDKIYLVRGRDN